MIRRYAPFVISAILFVFACGVPERPKVVTISKTPIFRPSSPKEIQTLEQAMAAIITVCRDDLGLPTVDPLYVHLYKNTVSFAFYGHGWRTLPMDVANVIASARGNEIHVNLEATGRRAWGELVELLAHEYGHNVQSKLTSTTSHLEQWFIEGFATWLAAKALHSLGWVDYGISLQSALRELSYHRNLLSQLNWLSDVHNWNILSHKPKAWIRTYTMAFVATHEIIDEHGIDAVLSYLRSRSFDASFATSKEVYSSKIEKYFVDLLTETQTPFVMNKPEWKLGDQWSYLEIQPGEKKMLTKQIVREDVYESLPVFVIETAINREERFYAKDTLGLLITKKDGKVIFRRDRPHKYFEWPIINGKEWKNLHTLENLEAGQTHRIDNAVVVVNSENVKVPAGSFEAAKIEMYDDETGRLQAQYWYSPRVKWFVKLRLFENGAVREQDLVSFQVALPKP